MNIFLIIRSLHPGGAERQIVALANGLAARGHSVRLAVFYAGGELEKDLYPAVTLVNLHKSRRWDIFSFGMRFMKAVKQASPDVLYAFLGTANLISLLAKPFVSSTPIVWGVRASNMDLTNYGRLHHLHFKAECLLARFADAFIANSHAGAGYYCENGFPTHKTHVIANGIDTDKYRPQHLETEDGEAFTVGMAARVDPMKDHMTFLKAAAIATEKQPDLRFICIGRDVEQLTGAAAELGIADNVNLPGEKRDMAAVFNSLDLACLSSAFGEGFPNVLGEAMACGIPCIATDVGDCAHVVGDTGIIVPPRSPEALADAMLDMRTRILSEPDLSQKCRKRITTHFSLDAMVDSTLEQLKAAIAKGSPR